MKIDGRCHCGSVTYEAEIDPDTVEICHCSDCQTLTSSAFRVVVPALLGSFHLLGGELSNYIKVAESGNRRLQSFCSNCGTPIYATSADGEPRTYGLRMGAIVQRDQLAPNAQCWTRSAQPWVNHIAALPASETE